ncbi:otoferlin-like isoform X2 [Styela clava]
MSLTVKIGTLSGLKGKGNRQAKITFRDHSYVTQTIEDCESEADFYETFEWPVASAIEPTEQIHIQFYNFSKVFSNRPIGSFDMLLQEVVARGRLAITETLLDSNNTALSALVSLDFKYVAPDGKVGDWAMDEFIPEIVVADDFQSIHTTETTGSKKSGKTKGILKGFRGKQRPPDDTDGAVIIGNQAALADGIRQSRGEPKIEIDTVSIASMQMVEENVTNKRSKPEIRFEPVGMRPQDFQVSVSVIEARQLSGTNMDPVVLVQVGDDKKYTSKKESTNCPYYNEVFVFDYNIPKQTLFDKMIQLTVLHSRNIVRSGTLVGTFKMDVGTVYANNDHMFFHKWAVLTDPDDLNTGPKGYLKVDISVVGKGDSIKLPKSNDDEEDNIEEKNMLLPEGVPAERQRARFIFKVYRAEGLPKMNTRMTEKLKSMLQGEMRDLVDPYVEISFCGQKGCTSVRKHSYEPSWNEEVIFTELFPPLSKRIKVQLRDKDNIKNSVIGTTFLDLDKISNSGDRAPANKHSHRHPRKRMKIGDLLVERNPGFLPTFGPTYVNLYGSPRNYTVVNEHSDLNAGLGEGVAFRGRMLIGLSVQLVDMSAADGQGSSAVEVETIPQLSELGAGRIEDFFLFTSILEANMVSRTLQDKQISFELTVGNFGNVIDGQNLSNKTRSNGDSDESDEETTSLLKGIKIQEDKEPDVRSMTSPTLPITKDKDSYYYHLPFLEQKPCLYITSQWHDQKRRMYNSNIMHKIADKLDEGLQDVQEMLKTDQDAPHRRLRGVVEELANGCASYTRLVKGTESGGGAALGRTRLDKERNKLCLREMDNITTEARKIRKQIKPSTMKDKHARVKILLNRIKFLADDPQSSVPDVFLWMICGMKRVAYARIPARKILYSIREEESGQHCGKVQTVFLRFPGRRSIGPGGWSIQAKLEMYMWFGLAKHKRDYLKGLPEGFEQTRPFGLKSPPTYITYKEKQVFQLRCHIYMARGLIAADDSGLSDPYAKVIFATCTSTTQVMEETLNPTWDQTLVMEDVTLYGRAEELRDDPPVIIIEIFDRDVVGNNEYIGRTMAKPLVKMSWEKYEKKFPPQLDWYQIYRGSTRAGELLASFELLQMPFDEQERRQVLWRSWCEMNDNSKNKISLFQVKTPKSLDDVPKVAETVTNEQGVKFPVPKGIRPLLAKHKVEVLFWGLRDLKRVQLATVDQPRVDIQIAGKAVSSCIIPNYKKNPNFAEPVRFIDEVDLPENEYLCPPITITVVDCRAFGREVLVGTHIISSLSKFIFRPPEKSEMYTAAIRLFTDTLQGIKGRKQHMAAISRSDVNITLAGSQGGLQHLSPPPPGGMVEIAIDENGAKEEGEEDDPLDEAALDWWSKYFASLDTLNEEKARQEAEEGPHDLYDEDERSPDDPNLPNVPKDDGYLGRLKRLTISRNDDDVPDQGENGGVGGEKKVGKRLFKGAVGAVKLARKGLASPAKKWKNKKLPIDELRLYDTELENVTEFSGFHDLLHSFDLFRGKREDDADDLLDQKRIVGTFKGAFKIYRLPLAEWIEQPDPLVGMFKSLPSNEPLHVMVRVYVVRANDLHPTDPNGKADPYLMVLLGNQKVNDKENYVSKQLNPMFGKTFEFEATFPMESVLTVQVYDWDLLSADDLIGETKLDLENRFYSKHRATCGIAEKYSIFGYNQWRDPMKPSQILAKLCKDYKIEGPHFSPGKVKVGKKIYTGSIELEDENGHKKPTDEHVALVALRNWHEIQKVGCHLAPEHVETRSLFSPEKPGIEQGRLELWVDMFPMDMPMPGPAVDISPRKPKGFQLRVIIWNTEDVVLQDDDFFTGEKASDIYVKGWLVGEDKQETDIHYRSLTGEGNFNWRFIYPFDYLIAEEKIVITKKESLFAWDETEFKIPPRLNLQVWDADHFSADDFLGSLTLDLTHFPRGAKSAAKCSLNMATEEDDSSGKDIPMISLFKQRRIKGWWPFTAKNDQDELEITGKVEAEIVLMTADEAEKNPAGYGRDEPDPLEKPNRPDTSFVWFMNPLKSLRYLICTRFKWLIIKLFIVLLLTALLVLFVYSSPSWLMKKILGA